MTLIDKDQMEKHIMESKVFTQYFKELVQALIWVEEAVDAVEVVHAEWVADTEFATKTKYKCSACDRTIMANNQNPNIKFPYCHCGAKMDGHKKEES